MAVTIAVARPFATKLPENLPDDSYDVFLRISQYGNWPSDNNYSTIRFANDSTYFDNVTGANLVGSFVLSKKAPVITGIPKEKIPQSNFKFYIHDKNLYINDATSIEIFDIKGVLLHSQKLSLMQSVIALNSFPKGLLVIKIYNQNKSLSQIIRNQ